MQTMGKYNIMLMGYWDTNDIRMELCADQIKMAADLMIDCLQQCEDLLSHVRTFCHEMEGAAGASPNGATLEGLLLSVEVALAYCVLLGPLILELPETETDTNLHRMLIITIKRDVAEKLEAILEAHERATCPLSYSRGRPKLSITEGQILELLDAQFSFSDIARLLGCSYKTVCRRRHEFGITEARWTNVTEDELDIRVTQFIDEHPISSQRMLMGYLQSCGVHVPRRSVRESIMRVDPNGVRS